MSAVIERSTFGMYLVQLGIFLGGVKNEQKKSYSFEKNIKSVFRTGLT